MVSSHEMKKGLALAIEGEPYFVVEWQHVEQERESANIRMKLRHLRTCAIIVSNIATHLYSKKYFVSLNS